MRSLTKRPQAFLLRRLAKGVSSVLHNIEHSSAALKLDAGKWVINAFRKNAERGPGE